jgi:hypothetical protein
MLGQWCAKLHTFRCRKEFQFGIPRLPADPYELRVRKWKPLRQRRGDGPYCRPHTRLLHELQSVSLKLNDIGGRSCSELVNGARRALTSTLAIPAAPSNNTTQAARLRRYSPLGKLGLTATLFLVGTSLSKRTITQVGFRPLLQGVVLWIIVGCVSLGAICYNLISI